MAKKETLETVNFNNQMKGERALYLGKLKDDDLIPGSDVTVAEAREANRENDSEFENERQKRKDRVSSETAANATHPRQLENQYSTTVVVPGVIVNLDLPEIETAPVNPTTPPPNPASGEADRKAAEESLKLSRPELEAIAVTELSISEEAAKAYPNMDKLKADILAARGFPAI